MMKNIGILLVILTMFGCKETKQNNNKATISKSKKSIPKSHPGDRVYMRNCVVCHGPKGDLGIGGAYNLQTTQLDRNSMIEVITQGRNGMPPFGSSLKTKEVKDVVDFILEINK